MEKERKNERLFIVEQHPSGAESACSTRAVEGPGSKMSPGPNSGRASGMSKLGDLLRQFPPEAQELITFSNAEAEVTHGSPE